MIDIGELALCRKRIAVQPVDQLLAVGTDNLRLRVVHVQINETRHDQGIGVGGYGCFEPQRIFQRGIRAKCLDVAVFQYHQRVGFVMHGGFASHQDWIGAKGERRTAQGMAGHSLNRFLRHDFCNLRDQFVFVVGLHQCAAIAVFDR